MSDILFLRKKTGTNQLGVGLGTMGTSRYGCDTEPYGHSLGIVSGGERFPRCASSNGHDNPVTSGGGDGSHLYVRKRE